TLLGVPYDDVSVVEGDTDWNVAGLNSVGSRSLQTAGSAIVKTVTTIIEKGRRAAAQVLQAAGQDVVFAVEEGIGTFRVAGSARSITLPALAATLKQERIAGFEDGLDSDGAHDGIPTFPNGCHVCEVEIDPETGKVAIDRYVIVDDLGRLINPMIVTGQ